MLVNYEFRRRSRRKTSSQTGVVDGLTSNGLGEAKEERAWLSERHAWEKQKKERWLKDARQVVGLLVDGRLRREGMQKSKEDIGRR